MKVWSSRRALIGVALLAMAACGGGDVRIDSDLAEAVASAESGATLRLQPGTYQGPIVVDKPLLILGGPGVVVTGDSSTPTISIVDTDHVRLEGLTVHGGESGVHLRRAGDVSLVDLTIIGADLHGIFAHDAQMEVVGCRVSGLTAARPQGVEIINSDSRPPSIVRGCVIEGPVFEGIVSHVARVVFADNEVTGASPRGIVVTEMSIGEVTGNRVSGGTGAAYFCGDMSACSVTGNSADSIGGVPNGPLSALGHALVVHFHSVAYVDGLVADGIAGARLEVMLGSSLLDDPVDPADRTAPRPGP